MKTIAIDIDDVCADLIPAWQARYNERYNDNLIREDWNQWDITKCVKPECGVAIYNFLHDPALYLSVQPVEGALAGVERLLADGFDVLFATSCGYDPATIRASAGAKFEWLQRHGFLPKNRAAAASYIVTADKSRVVADALVDDRADTIEKWGWRGILFDRPHNRSYKPLGFRADNWHEVIGAVRATV